MNEEEEKINRQRIEGQTRERRSVKERRRMKNIDNCSKKNDHLNDLYYN